MERQKEEEAAQEAARLERESKAAKRRELERQVEEERLKYEKQMKVIESERQEQARIEYERQKEEMRLEY